jgi:nucleotide-binding universal stress UspA family protein
VLVAFDGSTASREAAYWAAEEAASRNRPLHLVHALRWPGPALAGLGLPESVLDEPCARAAATALMQVALQRCRQHAAGVVAEGEVVPGDAVEVLAGAAAQAELLVLGACGQSAVPSVLLGSSAGELLRTVSTPVVVVRDSPGRAAVGRVVVGVDGSPDSEEALRFAIAVAARRRWELTAVHAWSDIPLEALTGRADLDRAELQEHAATALAARLAAVRPAEGDVPIHQLATVDHPAAALLTQAVGASLLVVGRHGRARTEPPLGSVSHAVAYYAPCPVAIVGGPASDVVA